MNDDDLKLVALVINEPGMELIEQEIAKKIHGLDTVERIQGNLFDDGCLKGTVNGLKIVRDFIIGLRRECKKIKEE